MEEIGSRSSSGSKSFKDIKELEEVEIKDKANNLLNYFSYDSDKKMILLQSVPFFSKGIQENIKEQASNVPHKEKTNNENVYNQLVKNIAQTNIIKIDINGNFSKNNKDIKEIGTIGVSKQYLATTKTAFNEFVEAQNNLKNQFNLLKKNSKNIEVNFNQKRKETKFYFIENNNNIDNNTYLISFTNKKCKKIDTTVDPKKILEIPLSIRTAKIKFTLKNKISDQNIKEVKNKIIKHLEGLKHKNTQIQMFNLPDNIDNKINECIQQGEGEITFDLTYNEKYLEYCLSLANQGGNPWVSTELYPFYYPEDLPEPTSFTHKWLHEYALKEQKVYENLGIVSEADKTAKLEKTIELKNINEINSNDSEINNNSSEINNNGDSYSKKARGKGRRKGGEKKSISESDSSNNKKNKNKNIRNTDFNRITKNLDKYNYDDSKKNNSNNSSENKNELNSNKNNKSEFSDSNNKKNSDDSSNNKKNNDSEINKKKENISENNKSKKDEIKSEEKKEEEENQDSKDSKNKLNNKKKGNRKGIKIGRKKGKSKQIEHPNKGEDGDLEKPFKDLIDDKIAMHHSKWGIISSENFNNNLKKKIIKRDKKIKKIHVSNEQKDLETGYIGDRRIAFFDRGNGEFVVIPIDRNENITDLNIEWKRKTVGEIAEHYKSNGKKTQPKHTQQTRHEFNNNNFVISKHIPFIRQKKRKSIIIDNYSNNNVDKDNSKKNNKPQTNGWNFSSKIDEKYIPSIYNTFDFDYEEYKRECLYKNQEPLSMKKYIKLKLEEQKKLEEQERQEKQNNKNKMNKQPLFVPVNNRREYNRFGLIIEKDGVKFDEDEIPQSYCKNNKHEEIQRHGGLSHTDMFNEKNLKAMQAEHDFWKKHSPYEKMGKYGNNILQTINSSNNTNKQFKKIYNNLVKETKNNFRFDPQHQKYKPIYEPNQNLVKRNALAYIDKVNAKNKDFTSNVNNNNIQIQNYRPRAQNLSKIENDIAVFTSSMNAAGYNPKYAWAAYNMKGFRNDIINPVQAKILDKHEYSGFK